MAADAFYAQSPTGEKHDTRTPLVPDQESYTFTLYRAAVQCPVFFYSRTSCHSQARDELVQQTPS